METTDSLEVTATPLSVPTWVWLVMALALAALYTLTLENGVVLSAGATTVHEFFHDGRHFLGVPCH